MKAYHASAKGCGTTAATPRAAATDYFYTNPKARKCDVDEGETDGAFFTMAFDLTGTKEKPRRWRNVTKKEAGGLT